MFDLENGNTNQEVLMKRKLLLIIFIVIGIISIVFGFSACGSGKSAYEQYLDSYIEENGTADGALSESEWLASLKGDKGDQGNQGDDGLSAYEIYKKYTTDDPVLSEEEWLESLKGDKGVGISKVDIVCGSIIITFTDNSTYTIEDAYPEAGHSWVDGQITTNPTCVTLGVKTYTCNDCGATKKEIVDAVAENHIYGDYEIDEAHHWRTCRLCGNIFKEEHGFGGASKDSDVNQRLECECGINKTVGEYYSFKVKFEYSAGVSIIVYDTQDYSVDGTATDIAYARSKTGELLNDGEGQVNFEVVVALGYKLKTIEATPDSGYKNLKGKEDTGYDNIYRITKITSDLIVSVVVEIDALDLPVMVINTENAAPILDKENYVNCTISVMNADSEYCFTEAGAGIRGRGNSTWERYPKKPYKLKFDKKIDLFGNGAAKKWTLIANHGDPSLIRNYLAYIVGAEFEELSATTTSVQFVELYLNGQYDGVYLVCEQNEVGKTRVDIEDDFSVAVNPEDMGYLLELDGRAPQEGIENLDYVVVYERNYAIKSPDYENADETVNYSDYVGYIKSYLQNTWNALYSNNYNLVCSYIDVDSFSDSYIVHEVFKMCDVGFASFYVYKKPNDKLYSGPIWDFDKSSGNSDYVDNNKTDILWSPVLSEWYRVLIQYDEFVQLVSTKLISYENVIKNKIDDGLEYVYQNSSSFLRNFDRWDILGTYVWPNPDELVAIKTWEGQVEYVKEWLLASLKYMMAVYCS